MARFRLARLKENRMTDTTSGSVPRHADQDAAAPSYVIGLDFGTESARAILIRSGGPQVLASAIHPYRRGVIQGRLAGRALPLAFALQDADDYLHATEDLLRRVAEHLPPGTEVAGLGLAFTSSSPLPTTSQGEPLSRRFPDHPHAYVKLWKHRAAAQHAQPFQAMQDLEFYGGSSSPEWLPAKAQELAAEAPELWTQTARFIEAGDWLVWQLSGQEVRSTTQAGYKAHFRHGRFHKRVDEALDERLGPHIPQPPGTSAGCLSADWQARTGLPNRPQVAVSAIDAHAASLGLGLIRPGELTAILGTSACYLLSTKTEQSVPGISGVVDGGIIPGLFGYEAGQAGFGDVLTWFVRTYPAFPGCSEGESFEYYNAQAAFLRPGEHGLLALDWFNGCRTPLDRGDLSGLLLGYSTSTSPTDIYRALLESLCFGARRVLETFARSGVAVQRVVLTGGLSEKHALLVQLLCDVLGRPLEVALGEAASARGAAIHAAVAGQACATFEEAVDQLADTRTQTVTPDPRSLPVYERLYAAYLQLSDLMAGTTVMSDVQALASEVRSLQPVRSHAGVTR
jgi:L-ribulokinase